MARRSIRQPEDRPPGRDDRWRMAWRAVWRNIAAFDRLVAGLSAESGHTQPDLLGSMRRVLRDEARGGLANLAAVVKAVHANLEGRPPGKRPGR